MRPFLALGLIAGAALPAAAENTTVVRYEILDSHEDCAGPGKIAYRAAFDTPIKVGGYFLSDNADGSEACSITTRKGTESQTVSFPCAAGAGPTAPIENESPQEAFCRATSAMEPVEMRLTGALVGCAELEGHTFVDGDWTVSMTRPSGTQVIGGAHDDPRLHVSFEPSRVEKMERSYPYLSIWIDLEDVALQGQDARVRVTGTTTLFLIRSPSCLGGDADCVVPPQPTAVTSYTCDPEHRPSRIVERYEPARVEN